MAQKRIAFKVHGTVQGVNFRSFTEDRASSLGLTGWVKNTNDDKVVGEAQGSEDALQKFKKEIDSGPRAAHVVKLETSEIDTKSGESSFTAS